MDEQPVDIDSIAHHDAPRQHGKQQAGRYRLNELLHLFSGLLLHSERPAFIQVRETSQGGNQGEEMAGVTGLEPATSGVTGQRSNRLSYTPAKRGAGMYQKFFAGQASKKK